MHRIGQDEPVTAWRIIAAHTIALFGGAAGGDGGSIPSSSRPAADLAGDGLTLIDALAEMTVASALEAWPDLAR